MANDEFGNDVPEMKVVQVAGVKSDDSNDANVTSSAQSRFWATSGDGREDARDDAPRAEQRAAFKEYENRPDIEQRASILARENAAPAQYTDPAQAYEETTPVK